MSGWLDPDTTDENEQDNADAWGRRHELWRMDIRDLDLGLVSDKIERAIRTAVVNHILVLDEAKRRPYILVVPSDMPYALLMTTLMAMFSIYSPPPNVILVPAAVSSVVAAGLRSALVVDIGWAETRVTAVYEYRETCHRRSSRGMKLLSWNVRCMLQSVLGERAQHEEVQNRVLALERIEEVISRMIWCQKGESAIPPEQASEEDDVSITLHTKPRSYLEIPFASFAEPVESTFVPKDTFTNVYDDHEFPLPTLIYKTLLALPIDMRQACSQRIVFTGGGANIPGLKNRLLAEVSHLIDTRGWDPVDNYGSITPPAKWHQTRGPMTTTAAVTGNRETATNKDIDEASTAPAHLQPPLPDPILASIQRRATQPVPTTLTLPERTSPQQQNPPPAVRSVATLGAWAGASLLAGLRIKGFVEIERERFLQHGLSGLEREDLRLRTTASSVVSSTASRQVSYANVATPGVDRSVWT